jgi:predicted nucleotidyltransferase
MKAFSFIDLKRPFQHVDILILERLDEIVSDAEEQDVGGFKIKIASKEKLIEMKKRAGREKDISDIRQLQQLMKK